MHGNLTIMAKYQLVKIFLVNAQKDSTPFVRVLPLAAHCHRNEVLFTITIKYECCITANPVMILWFGFEEEYDNGNDQTRVQKNETTSTACSTIIMKTLKVLGKVQEIKIVIALCK